ncbi:TonB-dependent receptor plug domain-containing protein [Brevundimonas sp.]|uniref:TonB-dependent receptor plug domain-containing protein n=1 Tax=Brevundimonas sp. TaxID=1871086 RepID=UPI003919E570
MAFPSFAMAQSQSEQDAEERSQRQATEVEAIVVTGSRIARTEFTSTQPVQIITSEQATLEGLADTTEILQSSTAANTATQINNFFTGFVTTGGPGVNTISLRGLGAQRTLVLVNGRRVGPAGVRGQVGPTDLNTIPGSQISRVEILTDGASSIYGSDAVAGVINIITRQNLDGGFAEVYASQPFEGGGEEYRISGTWGSTFDRGYISVGADYYERKALLFGDRDWFDCPQDRVYADENLTIRRDVRVGDGYKCNFTLQSIVRTQRAGGAVVTPDLRRDGDFRPNPGAVQGGGFVGCDINGWQQVAGGFANATGVGNNCSITQAPNAVRRAAYVDYPLYSDRYGSRTAISPVTRTSFSAFGGYDLTPNVELFGELLLNRRESEQRSWRQLFPTVSPFHSNNPWGGPFNGTTNTFGVGYFATPVALVNTGGEQQVDYARAVGGIRGANQFGGRTWDWELAAQFSRSDGTYGGSFFYNDRVEATAGLLAAFGEDLEGNVVTAPRPFGAANGNCDTFLLISATSCPTGGVNWFDPNFITNGVLPAEQMAFLLGYEEGTTRYDHAYIEGVISGELFNLPAGPLGAALGFQIRREEIDDQPGAEQQRNNIWGQTAAGRTTGSDTIREIFAEFEIPVIRDQPLFDNLSLNLSGRYSDYDSYGDNSTYKVGLNWQLIPQFRIRSSYGTSFRAPALYELFLANQTSFLGQAAIDPCRNWGTITGNDVLRNNCQAAGVPADYNDPGSSATITTGGGLGILDPETATAFSVGAIWTPSFIDLSIALDYYEIEVSDQVAQFGAANIISGCYNSENFPNEALCSLFVRDTNPGSTRFNQILSVNDSYVNISRQYNEGLDLNVRYNREFSFGDLQLNFRGSYILNWTTQTFGDSEDTILNGRVGSPEFVGQISARFDRGDWTAFWSADLVGETDNDPFFATPGNQTTYLGEPVFVERGTDFYQSHNVSLRRRFDTWTLQAGIRNLFDQAPPYHGTSNGSNRIGNTPLATQYDWNGRTGFVTISKTF